MNLIEIKKDIKKWKKILLLIIVAIFIEIIICNFPAFRTIFLGNNNMNAKFTYEENKIIIEDIGKRATSLYFIYDEQPTAKITYKVAFVPREDSTEIKLNEKTILKNGKHYINFDTHSECEKIEVELKTNSKISIKQILVNHPNFNINFCRIFLILCIGLIILKIKNEDVQELLYEPDSEEQKIGFIMVWILICVFITLYTIFQSNSNSLLIKPEKLEKDDALLMQTEAFMQGRISLAVTPSKELLQMEDPYNVQERVNQRARALFDIAYYNGKYYSYFGIAPIITLILPFRILTGMYMHSYMFNLIYIFAIIFLLYDVYRRLIQKYVKKVTLCNFYLGYFAILTASNILTTLRGAKYDIVATSGIMFLLLALSLIMRLGESKKYKKLKLIGIGISTALVVLSKPSFIIYYPLIAFFLWINMRSFEKKENLKNVILIMIPLGIFAILQMIYNWLRFDNPFEFGAKYQLTTFNMQYCMMFSFGKIYAGLLEYIFRTPTINPLKFPFVFINTNTNMISMNEICYENRLMGLIAIPILWIFLFSKYILKKEDKELKNFTKISLMTTILAIIINSCAAGICESYIIDIKCILAINAMILLLKTVDYKQNTKEIKYLFMILCVSTILIMLPINLTTESSWLSNMESYTTIFLRNIFEFWV